MYNGEVYCSFVAADPAMSRAREVSFTVAVCAYNAVPRIGRALEALAAMRFTGPWEVLVVDNASTDGTGALAQTWERRLPALRVVHEATPGLAFARRRAMEESRADYVCFVDDDNLVAADYLEAASEVLRAHANIGVLVARSDLFQLAPAPAWFDEVSHSYAVGELAGRDGFLSPNTVIWGAGFFVSRAAWSIAVRKGFAPLLHGRKGVIQLAGEDSEISLALNVLGWRTYYASTLKLKHAIEPARLNLRVLEDMNRGFGVAANVLQAYRSLLEGGARGWVKRRDLPYATLIFWQLARAFAKRWLTRGLTGQVELWRAQGCVKGFMRLGLRPSRVRDAPFFRRVAAGR